MVIIFLAWRETCLASSASNKWEIFPLFKEMKGEEVGEEKKSDEERGRGREEVLRLEMSKIVKRLGN